MKVAIVHEWLTQYAGSERVVSEILAIYPEADLFCIVDFLSDNERSLFLNKKVKTSFIQKLPFARKRFRNYLPLMPLAIEQFDLSAYDLIISSSHAVAKGVITGPDQLHICYVHSPIRYAWDLQHQYLEKSSGLKGLLSRWTLHYMRIWDIRTANGVGEFIANSQFIAKRIWKVYRRHSTVIYPPVELDKFTLNEHKENYYLTVSRMVPYKKVDLIVEAFSKMPDKKLVVIGDGPLMSAVQRKATRNIEVLGFQPDETVKQYMQKARAFVFAAEEDFGITPVEAQACGTPVIAYGKGGALETIKGLESESPTGVFFYEQSVDAIIEATNTFEAESDKIKPEHCHEHASKFSAERFRREISEFVEKQNKSIDSGDFIER